jgi:hypothetical protein
MNQIVGRWRTALAVSVMAAGMLACNLQYAPAAESPTVPAFTQPPSTLEESAATPGPTAGGGTVASPPVIPVESPTATAPASLAISAVGGQLNVRRGPGPEYNPVGALKDGQSTLATARNADTSWLYIQAPGGSKALGWVTIETQYTSVQGDPAALPVMNAASAAPAYIRNCTAHQMLVDPGAQILPDRGNTPGNELQVFPGDYTVTDDVTGSQVASPSMFEGQVVEIKKDGDGKKYSCP